MVPRDFKQIFTMIIIADSGSTKCDWVLGDSAFNLLLETSTMGFNPYFHNEATIANAVKQNDLLAQKADDVKLVFYYGAGCSSESLRNVVRRALKITFPNAKICIEHDLTGAAFATHQGKEGISCILGTGSNSCYFDGKKIHEAVPALGYILGDEGSGSYFGKRLLALFMYKQLPKKIHAAFEETYGLTTAEIVANVYNKPHANVYLASFTKFISSFKNEPIFEKMLVDGMHEFLSIHVKCYPQSSFVPVHFVGSVAYYFQDAIYQAAQPLEIKVDKIVKRPILPLLEYHKARQQSS